MAANTMSVRFGAADVRRFETDLKALGEKVVPVARKALRAASLPIVARAKAAAPRLTGRLQKSIGHVVRVYRGGEDQGVTVVSVIGSTKDAGGKYPPYAHLVEFGTKPHMMERAIMPGGKVLRNWMHPGTPPRSYLHASFQSLKEQALAIIAQELDSGVKKLMIGSL